MMKNFSKSLTCCLLAVSVLAASCSSSTVINSVPPGAKLYVEEEYVGKTPYQYKDQKILGSKTRLRLEKEGYDPKEVILTRNEEIDGGAIVGALFLIVPVLWIQEYKATHVYELEPATNIENEEDEDAGDFAKMAENLKKLKALRDEGILTEKEYQAKKKELLESTK